MTMLTKEEKIQAIQEYTPEGQSSKVYYSLLKDQIMGTDKFGNERSDGDLLLFLYISKKTGLDPLARQIFPVYRWDSRLGKEKMTVQVGIDGMRAIAQASKQYAGQEDVKFEEKDGKLTSATATVIKSINGEIIKTSATARWGEYLQTGKDGQPMGLWSKMPYLMLGKCAEALALRKAFPSELSGVYTQEELPVEKIELPKPTKIEVEKPTIDIIEKKNENKS